MAGSPDRDPMPRIQLENEVWWLCVPSVSLLAAALGFPSTNPMCRPEQNSLLNPECSQEVEH